MQDSREAVSNVELSVVVPAWNSHTLLPGSLRHIVEFLAQQPDPAELIVVDDHSTPPLDSTVDRCGLNGVHRNVMTRLLHSTDPHGKGHAVSVGLLAATGRYRVFIDCDLAYPAGEIATILQALRDGHDVAIACRVLPQSIYVMSPVFFSYLYTRHLMSRVFNAIVRRCLVPGIMDTQAGLKGFTAKAVELIFPRLSIMGFGFDIECLYIARQHRLPMTQVPVTFRYDSEPTTVRFMRDAACMLGDIAKVRWNAWRGRYD